MSRERFDFSGWATKNNLRCSDGRTILKDAFKDDDGRIVPLVWMHMHNGPENVIGHALLENRKEGVYCYGKFNNTENGRLGKSLVSNGDITSLSIYANQLKQQNGNVLHGAIREVSLVLAGANPGASIEFPILAHGEEADSEAILYTGAEMVPNEVDVDYFEHSEDGDDSDYGDEEDYEMPEDKTIQDVLDGMTDEQLAAVNFLVAEAVENGVPVDDEDDYEDEEDYDEEDDVEDEDFDEDDDIEHADDYYDDDDEEDFYDDEELEHGDFDDGGYYADDMKYNVFDDEDEMMHAEALPEEEEDAIFADAQRTGSLADSFLAHAEDYGIDGIEWLFPEDRELNRTPEFIKREDSWVNKVMNGVHHTPFSRVKSTFANITEDEARARGYLKGHAKKEEVFSLLKRATTPQTIYKKQKMDRDDVIDITDFDVVSWLKGEMRMMLNEEIARAILIGDGRLASDEDKISEDHVRPIANDADLFTIKKAVTIAQNATEDEAAAAVIRAAVKARKEYKGSGNPICFTTEDWLTDMLLIEDGLRHRIYKTEKELATAMRVSEIVTVPVMEGHTVGGKELIAIIVNLADYNVGADKGGAVNMFEDFDIDYNQEKYLIETRCSGALTKPYSAIILFKNEVPTSVDGGVQRSKTTYTEVENPSGNPASLGYYVLTNGKYVLTTDTSVQSGTTYYVRYSPGEHI